MDIVGVIYIVGMVQSFFIIILLGVKQKKCRSDYYLMGFFLIITLTLLFALLIMLEIYKNAPFILAVMILLPLLFGPSLYFYVRSLLFEADSKIRIGFHWIPFVVTLLFFLPLFLNRNQLLASFSNRFIELPLYVNLGFGSLYLSAPVYLVWIQLILRQKRLNPKRQSIELSKGKTWLTRLLTGAMIVWLLEIVRMLSINYFDLNNPWPFSQFLKCSWVLFIFFLGFHGLRLGHVFVESDVAPNENRRKKKKSFQGVANIDDKIKRQQIIHYLEERKPYLNPNLKLMDMAIDLDIPSHLLSRLINDQFHMTFSSLINSYRVERAKTMLMNNKYSNVTILSIAYDCGFNSKSSFNRIFKEQTGLSPSMFIKTVIIGY